MPVADFGIYPVTSNTNTCSVCGCHFRSWYCSGRPWTAAVRFRTSFSVPVLRLLWPYTVYTATSFLIAFLTPSSTISCLLFPERCMNFAYLDVTSAVAVYLKGPVDNSWSVSALYAFWAVKHTCFIFMRSDSDQIPVLAFRSTWKRQVIHK